jgi:hypothetical protein
MIFTNIRATSKQSPSKSMNLVTNIKPLPLSLSNRVQKIQQLPSNNTVSPKLLWGPAIWYLFHGMAEKVKVDSFKNIRLDLLSNIQKVCGNLPCPTCSTHAVQYLKTVDMNKIQTKEDLKRMLYVFHNAVNKRTGKPEYSYTDLNTKYPTGNLRSIITVFFTYFEDKHKSVHMLSNDMYTMRISKDLRTWFTNNICHFDT